MRDCEQECKNRKREKGGGRGGRRTEMGWNRGRDREEVKKKPGRVRVDSETRNKDEREEEGKLI